jgi:hypothetical protein
MSLRLLAACTLALLTACGGATPREQVDAAQAALNSGDFAGARAAAEAALALPEVKADKGLAWRCEKLRLDALAGSRQGAEVLASLERLQASHPAQVDAALYASMTGKLSQAHDYLGATDIVHAGIEKFPDQKSRFEGELENLKKAVNETGDNAALEKLRSLGYL